MSDDYEYQLLAPYEPAADAPWNLRRVVHLHRRAGFAATWAELQRDLAGDPQEAVTRLLEGRARIDGQPADFESTARLVTDTATASFLDRRLKAAWVYRMLYGPDPLGERLVLMWHNHFATSNRKVKNLVLMQGQNDLFRQLGRGSFADLLAAVVRQGAMLEWLDADKNIAGHPNENLARESMELFTLGVGNYKEADVQEAARALTGWKLVGEQFRFDPKTHDDKPKTILSTTDNFDGDGLLKLLAAQPATAHRLAWRICNMLMGETKIEPSGLDELATGLRDHELRHRLGRRNCPPLAAILRRGKLGQSNRRTPGIRRGRGAGTRMFHAEPEHAALGGLDGPHGPRPVLSAQRRRLERRPRLAELRGHRVAGEFRRGTRRRTIDARAIKAGAARVGPAAFGRNRT